MDEKKNESVAPEDILPLGVSPFPTRDDRPFYEQGIFWMVVVGAVIAIVIGIAAVVMFNQNQAQSGARNSSENLSLR